jgi:hypothetical protein
MTTINTELLKARVKGSVRFVFFRDGALHYVCDDGWEFPVPVTDTENVQGSSPTFMAEDKGITFMRWVRKQMEAEAQLAAEVQAARQ